MTTPEVLDDAADKLADWVEMGNQMAGGSVFVSEEVIRMFGYLLGRDIARELVIILRGAQDRHVCHKDLCMWCSDDENDIVWPCEDVKPLLRVAECIMENPHV